MKRIRFLSTVAMVLMLPMLVYYPYAGLVWNLQLSFLDPTAWTRNDVWVDRDAQIALGTRVVFFIVWLLPVCIGFLGYVTGFSALMLLRRGVVFDLRIATRLKYMGLCIFSSSLTALAAGAVSPMIRSWHNAGGPLPLRFWYSSGDIGLMFCGLAFLFFGLVMREAIRIARENEEFV